MANLPLFDESNPKNISFSLNCFAVKVTETETELHYEALSKEQLMELVPDLQESAIGGCTLAYESATTGGIPYLVCKRINCTGNCVMRGGPVLSSYYCVCVD